MMRAICSLSLMFRFPCKVLWQTSRLQVRLNLPTEGPQGLFLQLLGGVQCEQEGLQRWRGALGALGALGAAGAAVISVSRTSIADGCETQKGRQPRNVGGH